MNQHEVRQKNKQKKVFEYPQTPFFIIIAIKK